MEYVIKYTWCKPIYSTLLHVPALQDHPWCMSLLSNTLTFSESQRQSVMKLLSEVNMIL